MGWLQEEEEGAEAEQAAQWQDQLWHRGSSEAHLGELEKVLALNSASISLAETRKTLRFAL